MKTLQALEKLKKIVSSDMIALERTTVFPVGNGYEAFGCYSILPLEHGGYSVHKHGIHLRDFSSLRSATSWCTADRYQKFNLGFSIERLDREKILLSQDLKTRSTLLEKSKNSNFREVTRIKVETRRLRLKEVSDQLDKCINMAKYWQLQGFNNETARTKRSATNRTDR